MADRTPNTNPPPLLVDRLDAARLLGVSPGSVDNLRKKGGLPSVKLGTSRRFDLADIRAFIEMNKGVDNG